MVMRKRRMQYLVWWLRSRGSRVYVLSVTDALCIENISSLA